MKYYISEYWEMLNSDNLDIQNKGDLLWTESVKQYMVYFETIKDRLPKVFLKIFNKSDWFHDFSIENINIMNTGKYSSIIEFKISHSTIKYKIIFKDVKSISVNIPTTQNWMCGMLTWGYTEFELNDKNFWVIRILCDFDCEIEILFKRISINKID